MLQTLTRLGNSLIFVEGRAEAEDDEDAGEDEESEAKSDGMGNGTLREVSNADVGIVTVRSLPLELILAFALALGSC